MMTVQIISYNNYDLFEAIKLARSMGPAEHKEIARSLGDQVCLDMDKQGWNNLAEYMRRVSQALNGISIECLHKLALRKVQNQFNCLRERLLEICDENPDLFRIKKKRQKGRYVFSYTIYRQEIAQKLGIPAQVSNYRFEAIVILLNPKEAR